MAEKLVRTDQVLEEIEPRVPLKGLFAKIGGKRYLCLDYVEPFLSRREIGDLIDIEVGTSKDDPAQEVLLSVRAAASAKGKKKAGASSKQEAAAESGFRKEHRGIIRKVTMPYLMIREGEQDKLLCITNEMKNRITEDPDLKIPQAATVWVDAISFVLDYALGIPLTEEEAAALPPLSISGSGGFAKPSPPKKTAGASLLDGLGSKKPVNAPQEARPGPAEAKVPGPGQTSGSPVNPQQKANTGLQDKPLSDGLEMTFNPGDKSPEMKKPNAEKMRQAAEEAAKKEAEKKAAEEAAKKEAEALKQTQEKKTAKALKEEADRVKEETLKKQAQDLKKIESEEEAEKRDDEIQAALAILKARGIFIGQPIAQENEPAPSSDDEDLPQLVTLSLGRTVSIGNYESFKVSVSAEVNPRDDKSRKALIRYWDSTTALMGASSPSVKALVDSYRSRVIKGALQ